jgi:uncharacterized coiled-coil protein SlyX
MDELTRDVREMYQQARRFAKGDSPKASAMPNAVRQQLKGKPMPDNEIRSQKIRELHYRLKQAHRNIGKQGQTIHQLRAELAEVRSLNSRLERGELRHCDAVIAGQNAVIDSLKAEIAMLNEKLQESVSSLEKLPTGTSLKGFDGDTVAELREATE